MLVYQRVTNKNWKCTNEVLNGKTCKFTNQKIKIKPKNWRLNQQEWGWNWQQSGWHQKYLPSDNLMDVHPRNGVPGLPWYTLVKSINFKIIVNPDCDTWNPCHSPTAPDPPGVTRHRFHAGQNMIQEIHPVHTCTYYIRCGMTYSYWRTQKLAACVDNFDNWDNFKPAKLQR